MANRKRKDRSQFYDEDGNIIATTWSLERDAEEEKERQEQAKREKKSDMREVKRKLAIDERRAIFEEAHHKEMEARKLRDEWLSMPSWIKSLPRTPLSDPPTEGTKEKAWFKMTGKVKLTEEERKRRERDLRILKTTIEDYRRIHRDFPEGRKSAFVSVVSLAEKIGTSTVVRGMSKAMIESRINGICIAVDFGRQGNTLHKWYKDYEQVATLKNIINQLNHGGVGVLTPSEIFPRGDEDEYLLENHDQPSRRIEMGIDDVFTLYEYLEPYTGITFFDCDRDNVEATVSSISISDTTVIIIPVSEHSGALLVDFLNNVKDYMDDDEEYELFLNTSIVVMVSTQSSMASAKYVSTLSRAAHKAAQLGGIERSLVIPYDKAFVRGPLIWKRARFPIKHALRVACGMIIDDVTGEVYDE